MFGLGKQKSPSVKIPSSVLKREAEKIAKKMQAQEERKERLKQQRERLKHQEKQKNERSKADNASWELHFHHRLRQEVFGGILIFLALFFVAIFFTDKPLAINLQSFFRSLFGIGAVIIPIFMVIVGTMLFFPNPPVFPTKRIAAILIAFSATLGIINLFPPLSDSLILAHQYGGMIGFSVSFFPREFLGDIVSWILFLGIFWVSFSISIGLQFRELIAFFTKKKSEASTHISAPATTEEKKLKNRFHNEVEIVDSTGKKPKNPEELTSEALDESKQKRFGEWEPPSLDLIAEPDSKIVVNEKKLREKAEIIREKLAQFDIDVSMRAIHVGPTVTQFTLEPASGVKLNKITALKNDLALALAAPSLRIEAPIRGKTLVGIEIPNDKRSTVVLREILESSSWEEKETPLKLALGRDVAGVPIVDDLAKMPHLLIAGKTGSGKSVAMNAFLLSLLWQNSPQDLRLILIDPKQVELKPYDHLPHLLTPVITSPEKAVSALAWTVAEMNKRYKKLAQNNVRNLAQLNKKNSAGKEPYIVVVVDELADLMMVAGKDVEAAICRIAQMARAVGIHLLVATQRPSVDVVTGLIKANLPARIAFRVNSGIDSRTIIDGIGAEDLLGFGDMLHLDGNSGMTTRVQGIFVSNEEVERVTNYIKLQFPEMVANDEITKQSFEGMAKGGVLRGLDGESASDEEVDEMFNQAVDLVLENNKASASFLQRRMEIGYARAARLLDQMERRGIIGPVRGAKPREIYGKREE